MTDREAYIALNMMDNVGPVRVRAMAAALGSRQAIFTASAHDLAGAEGIGRELAAQIVAGRAALDPAAEEVRASRLGARLVTPADGDYPPALGAIHDPPLALYVQGDLRPEDKHAVGIVGSRRCTFYGKSTADRLGYQLAHAGFTVVSGLARGIDWAAHEGALKAKGRTFAVLGSALDQIYPREGEPLARRIAETGAVISEYTLGRKPDRTTFPYRNRVISGLSMGVVVVEADTKSGAMITAHQALDQGRTVFAVPGRVDSPASRGTHRLLKGGARLVEDAADIFDEFEYLAPVREEAAPGGAAAAGPRMVFNGPEQAVVEALIEGALDIDTLARQAGLPSQDLSGVLLSLEMKRAVRMLPGRLVELAVTAPRDAAEA